jgi:Ca2+-binding EF-hand superfamily protein
MSFIKLADRDGSGKVSREEFLDALHRCHRSSACFASHVVHETQRCRFNVHMSAAELQQVMDSYDTNGDGHIDYSEMQVFDAAMCL